MPVQFAEQVWQTFLGTCEFQPDLAHQASDGKPLSGCDLYVRNRRSSVRSTARHNSGNGLDFGSWSSAKVQFPVQFFGIPYPFDTLGNMHALWNCIE